MRHILAVGSSAVLGLALAAPGAVITSTSTSAPSTNVVISQTTSTSERTMWDIDPAPAATPANVTVRAGGQSFTTTSSFVLDKITMKISNYDATTYPATKGASFTLDLFEFSSASASSTTNAPILSQTGVLPTDIAAGKFVTFDPSTNITLTSGKVYGYRLELTTNNSNVKFAVNGNNPYTGGRLLEYYTFSDTTPAGWQNPTGSSGWDYQFYVQSAVPEPGTLSLLGAGALLLMRRRRH